MATLINASGHTAQLASDRTVVDLRWITVGPFVTNVVWEQDDHPVFGVLWDVVLSEPLAGRVKRAERHTRRRV